MSRVLIPGASLRIIELEALPKGHRPFSIHIAPSEDERRSSTPLPIKPAPNPWSGPALPTCSAPQPEKG